MRNASKNTIKRVMRKAKFDQDKHDMRYHIPEIFNAVFSVYASNAYFLFNDVGAQIYRMSKGKICNRGLTGLGKYINNCKRLIV